MDKLLLKWKHYKTKKVYLLGALFRKENKYYFKLNENEFVRAQQDGFNQLIPFTDAKRIYESNTLFSIFKHRIPKIEEYTKEELEDFLKRYKMKYFDEFEYLKKTKGSLITDNLFLEGIV